MFWCGNSNIIKKAGVPSASASFYFCRMTLIEYFKKKVAEFKKQVIK